MKTLETEIKYQGRTLKQLKREGNVAMYEQGMHGYEVVVIRIRPASYVFGQEFPEHEAYPGNEDWGTYGWTYRADDLKNAEKRFTSLLPRYGVNVAAKPNKADLGASESKDSGDGVIDL